MPLHKRMANNNGAGNISGSAVSGNCPRKRWAQAPAIAIRIDKRQPSIAYDNIDVFQEFDPNAIL